MEAHPHHAHDHDHAHEHAHGGESRLADMLDLDAELLGTYLDELTAWVAEQAAGTPRTVADLGAGTGTGTLALARRFPAATIVAVDRSPVMLDRVRAAAVGRGLGERVRAVQGDLDLALPPVGPVDLVWAAASLHHVEEPARLLREVHAALNPGGLLAVVEMDGLPRFLPDEAGAALEVRCREAVTRARTGPDAYPEWTPPLTAAGFEVTARRDFPIEVAARRDFPIEVGPSSPSGVRGVARYAHAVFSGYRSRLDGHLAAADLAALDRLLSEDHPEALRHRDLVLRSTRTAWAARRA
ncbi:class I SAM-dependent methyltransferase [Nonomuraea spiralis]|uniref:Class I SAM-dependent methyltransferase n=1 Tax=Nonomuraea spiralis TaxID=46182 RepID=A0ABV5I6D4_9ACTN|nr:class I SAM-dependent methyltransferase [Nonomuraea spiralis]